jgi:hypothetical protein
VRNIEVIPRPDAVLAVMIAHLDCSGVGWQWLGQAYKALLLVQQHHLLRSTVQVSS